MDNQDVINTLNELGASILIMARILEVNQLDVTRFLTESTIDQLTNFRQEMRAINTILKELT